MTAASVAALAVGTSACGNSSSGSGSSTTSTAAPRPTSTTTAKPPATTTTAKPPATTTTVQLAGCTASQLSVSAGQSDAATGHIGVPLLFHNTGAASCTLIGYPGVAGLDAEGNQVVQAVRTPSGFLGGLPPGTTKPTTVSLTPGQTASAMVEGTDVPTGTSTSCPQYPALLVTPPNTTQSVRVAATVPGCSPIEVHPVVPGVTGSPE